ncbi:MAG: EAL domain-containing protein [Phormidesmis sp. RL_2_1]|nr:EAL domain-containing protein [Phormidesmis sp. RL_2_1]
MLKFDTEILSFEPTLEQRIDIGHTLLRSRQITKALKEFQAALAMAPELMYIHLTVGGIYARQQKYSEALNSFQTAMALEPFAASPPLAIAQIYQHLGQIEQAEAHFQIARDIDPKLDMVYVGLGQLALAQQQYAIAKSNGQTALAINPDLTEAQLLLAEAYQGEGRSDQAIAHLEAAISDMLDAAPALRLKLAELYREHQQYGAMQTVLEEFRSAYPILFSQNAAVQLDLAMAALATGAPAGQRALAPVSDLLPIAYRQQLLAGCTHMRLDDRSAAIAHYLNAWQIQQVMAASDSATGLVVANEVEGLRQAISQQKFELHYQPVIDLDTNRVVGQAARLQWQTPPLPEKSFPAVLSLSEASGLSQPIGWWSLFVICQQLAEWAANGDAGWISLPLTRAQFTDPDLPALLGLAVQSAAIAPASLLIEVDQAVLWEAIKTNSASLERLSTLSGGIAVTADCWDDSLADLLSLRSVSMLKLGHQMVQRDRRQPLAQSIALALRAKNQSLPLASKLKIRPLPCSLWAVTTARAIG